MEGSPRLRFRCPPFLPQGGYRAKSLRGWIYGGSSFHNPQPPLVKSPSTQARDLDVDMVLGFQYYREIPGEDVSYGISEMNRNLTLSTTVCEANRYLCPSGLTLNFDRQTDSVACLEILYSMSSPITTEIFPIEPRM